MRDDSDLQLLCFSCHICIFDWCDDEYNYWPTDINLLLAEEKWLKEEVVKNGFKRFTQSGLVPYYMASRMRKEERSGPCPYDRFIHLHCHMPTNAPTSVNTCILNLVI